MLCVCEHMCLFVLQCAGGTADHHRGHRVAGDLVRRRRLCGWVSECLPLACAEQGRCLWAFGLDILLFGLKTIFGVLRESGSNGALKRHFFCAQRFALICGLVVVFGFWIHRPGFTLA